MAALNQQETDHLSVAQRVMSDAQTRLKRMIAADDIVGIDKDELEFMVENLRNAERLVKTVKQMKGYYPK